MVLITKEELYNNINNNKVYLDIPQCKYEQSIDSKNNCVDYEKIFNNMSLRFIKNNTTSTSITKNITEIIKNNTTSTSITKNITEIIKNKEVKTNKPYTNNKTKNIRFEKDSFVEELSKLLMKRNKDIRNEIKDFVISRNNLDYIKTLTRSHKKFIIDINNLLLNENLDKFLTDHLLIVICKIYNINIVIFNNDIYKKYISNEDNDYYVFEKYIKNTEKSKFINYRLDTSIQDINEFVNNKKIYVDHKEFKNMKVDELREYAHKNNIVSTQKKTILLEKLNNIYKIYN